jgi:hypothetical protein
VIGAATGLLGFADLTGLATGLEATLAAGFATAFVGAALATPVAALRTGAARLAVALTAALAGAALTAVVDEVDDGVTGLASVVFAGVVIGSSRRLVNGIYSLYRLLFCAKHFAAERIYTVIKLSPGFHRLHPL